MFDNFFERLYDQIVVQEYYKLLLDGLWVTIQVSLAALVLGIIIGTLLAVIKVVPKKSIFGRLAEWIANIYITVIRGIPMVVLLFLLYFVLFARLLEFMEAIWVAILAMGINSGAYVAEIIRSGILAVDHGQMEAGRSLGLTYRTTMWKIVLPQAIKNILPALGNEFITLIKDTSVVGFITVFDLTRAARAIVANTYDVAIAYIVLAAVYLILVLGATALVNLLERRLRRSDRR